MLRNALIGTSMTLAFYIHAAWAGDSPNTGAARTAPATRAPAAASRATSEEELESLRLQSLVNKQKKAEETASGVIKKESDTTGSVRGNVK
jgi:hypothetical protein